MGRVGEEEEELSDFKLQLVTEICSISSRSRTSVCRIHHRSSRSPFNDWYLLLRVKEDAHVDTIRKQYRKLALLLHPDKNRHPKAEVAFRLVSEAYACLSDQAKRRAFELERCNSFCKECNRISSKNYPSDRLRTNTVLHQLREVRDRFREEVRVIDNCLKVNKASRKESPVFDPSEYMVKDYPHSRTQMHKTPENFRYLRVPSIPNFDQRRGKCESPIFELGPERQPCYLRSAYLSS